MSETPTNGKTKDADRNAALKETNKSSETAKSQGSSTSANSSPLNGKATLSSKNTGNSEESASSSDSSVNSWSFEQLTVPRSDAEQMNYSEQSDKQAEETKRLVEEQEKKTKAKLAKQMEEGGTPVDGNMPAAETSFAKAIDEIKEETRKGREEMERLLKEKEEANNKAHVLQLSTVSTMPHQFDRPKVVIYRFLNVLITTGGLKFDYVNIASNNLPDFLALFWGQPQLDKVVDQLCDLSYDDHKASRGVSPRVFKYHYIWYTQASLLKPLAVQNSICRYLNWRTFVNNKARLGRKRTGPDHTLIRWVVAYAMAIDNGTITIHDRYADALKQRHKEGVKQYVFSRMTRGLVDTNRRLLELTTEGNLSAYIDGYLDAGTYSSVDDESYVNIAKLLGVTTGDIMLVTTELDECVAASTAGCVVVKVKRPGVEKDPIFPNVRDMSYIEFVTPSPKLVPPTNNKPEIKQDPPSVVLKTDTKSSTETASNGPSELPLENKIEPKEANRASTSPEPPMVPNYNSKLSPKISSSQPNITTLENLPKAATSASPQAKIEPKGPKASKSNQNVAQPSKAKLATKKSVTSITSKDVPADDGLVPACDSKPQSTFKWKMNPLESSSTYSLEKPVTADYSHWLKYEDKPSELTVEDQFTSAKKPSPSSSPSSLPPLHPSGYPSAHSGKNDCQCDKSPCVRYRYIVLRNEDFTCYSNSVFQLIYLYDRLREYFTSDSAAHKGPFHAHLHKLFQDIEVRCLASIYATNYPTVNLEIFNAAFRAVKPDFRLHQQQDAQEYLTVLFELLHQEVNRAKKAQQALPPQPATSDEAWTYHLAHVDNSDLSDMMMGQMESTVTCMTCSNQSHTWSSFWQLQLDLSDVNNTTTTTSDATDHKAEPKSLSLQDCIRELLSEETLKDDCAPYCDRCSTKRPSTKRQSICRTPAQLLIIHLKRFSPSGTKIGRTIDIDDQIELGGVHYQLHGCVVHVGTELASGHYIALVRQSARHFVELDDERIRDNVLALEAHETQLCHYAYLCMYVTLKPNDEEYAFNVALDQLIDIQVTSDPK